MLLPTQRVWDEGASVSLTSSFLEVLLTLKQLLLMEQNLKQGTQGTQRVCQPTWGQTVSATATGLPLRGEQASARAGSGHFHAASAGRAAGRG